MKEFLITLGYGLFGAVVAMCVMGLIVGILYVLSISPFIAAILGGVILIALLYLLGYIVREEYF
jgi:uncharacterized membrane protein YeaQ/YmgE (transglycosylase-associated protein family)